MRKFCEEGWPKRDQLSGVVKKYHHIAGEISTVNEILMRGSRIIIPARLRAEMLEKIGTDLFEWKGQNYLMIVDYYSRFIEIALLKQTTASEVIAHTKSIFARHGVPELVFSDNGHQYTSAQYKKFSQDYGFEHITSS